MTDREAASQVGRVTTRDADEHHAWLSAHYHDHERRVRPSGPGFAFSSEACATGRLTFGRSRYRGVTVKAWWPPTPFVGVGHIHSGRHLMRWDGGEVRVAGRGVVLALPYAFEHLHGGTDTSVLVVSIETVLRVAQEASGLDRTQLRFTGLSPVSPAAEQQWLATESYVQRSLYRMALNQPLLLGAAERMVAASMLTTFPNTTMTAEVRAPRDPATPATVRRAMAYIEARAGTPVTMTEIAVAAGVVPRTLQYAFRHHHDTTPMDYLRRVRLARAHEDLLAAEPGDGTTVAEVAARWGYARPHRFAAAYRAVYGHAPSRTLRA